MADAGAALPTEPPEARELVLLDACCLLNLYATRRMEEILRAIPADFAAAERSASETLYVRRGGSGEDADERDIVNLQPLIDMGLLEVLQPESAIEEASYVNFAADLDDGEAMTCALALHRGAAIATDDRKVMRVLKRRASHTRIMTTTELIKTWVDSQHIDEATLRQVLAEVRERARFFPGNHDPHKTWWDTMVSSI